MPSFFPFSAVLSHKTEQYRRFLLVLYISDIGPIDRCIKMTGLGEKKITSKIHPMVRVKFEKNMKLFFSFFHNIFHSIHSLSVSAHHGNSKSDHVSWLNMIYSPLNEIRPNERWLYLVQKALNNTKHNKIGVFSVFHTFSMRTRSFEVIKVGFWKKNYFYPKYRTW